jgi:hypothetical protein
MVGASAIANRTGRDREVGGDVTAAVGQRRFLARAHAVQQEGTLQLSFKWKRDAESLDQSNPWGWQKSDFLWYLAERVREG